ncbi:MAG TPA: tetratricopeptide repeat protein [Chitinophagales bacterium]|nr:tetratricopeptide repeat protein [Chitinophagales bacterium]
MSKKTSYTKPGNDKPTPVFVPAMRLPLIAAAFAFLLYVGTIGHGYVLDDEGIIVNNEYVQQGIKGIGKLLTTEVWQGENAKLGYYRPLSLISFAIEQQLFGGNPHISHFINILLYAATAFFVCLLLLSVFKDYSQWFPFAITLLFIAHPLHTEVVANIKSRDEILSFLNLAVALYAILRSMQAPEINYKWLALSVLCFYLALLSKESAMVGILLAPLLLYYDNHKNNRALVIAASIFGFVLLAFQLQKYAAIGTFGGMQGADIVNYPYAENGSKLATMFLIFAWGIKLILFPYPLHYSYAYNQIPAAEFSTVGAIVGVLLAAIVLFAAYQQWKEKTPVFLALLFFIFCLAPAMAFVLLRGGIFAERFLYAPVLGFCIVVVWLLAKAFKWDIYKAPVNIGALKSNTVFSGIILTLLLAYSAQTIGRSSKWHDNLTLIAHDANHMPANCQAHLHYGTLLVTQGISSTDVANRKNKFELAAPELTKALQINPHLPEAWFQYAQAYHKLAQNADSAILLYNNAIRENAGYALAYLGLASLYESTGQQQFASYYYNKAVAANPLSVDANTYRNNHRAKTGLDIKDYPAQNIPATDDITVPGKDAAYYNTVGKQFGERGDFANALRYLQKSVEMAPTADDPLVDLAVCYAMMRNYTESIAALEKALQLNPNNETALTNIAIMYRHTGVNYKADIYTQRLQQLKGTQ